MIHSMLFERKESAVLKREKEFLEDLLYVTESQIHGAGLFTSVGINKGQKIMIIKGESISGDECERREEDGNVYIFWNGETYIDTAMTDKIKFINHNCRYNCDIIDRDEDSLYLIAARYIAPDAELTIDYGYEEIYELCCCEICSDYVGEELEIKKAV